MVCGHFTDAMAQHQEDQAVRVSLDPKVVRGLDISHEYCPTINRSALVNQIVLEWLNGKDVFAPRRLRQS